MRLGEILIARKQLAQEDLDRALELQKERGDKIGRILVDLGFVAQRDIIGALSEQLNLPVANLESPPPVTPETERLSPRFLRQAKVIPGSHRRFDAGIGDGRPAGFRDDLDGAGRNRL